MGEPLITVVVAIYNVESYLDRCIRSICNQTYEKLQIVLVDNASTDNSGLICTAWKNKDKRIEVIREDNRGLVQCRKTGIQHAKGEFISCIDGDDYLERDMYQVLMEAQCRTEADVVNSGFYSENAVIHVHQGELVFSCDNTINSVIKYAFDLDSDERVYSCIWSKLFRKEVLRKAYSKVPNDCSFGEDLICLINCMNENIKWITIDRPLYHYVKRSDSIVNSAECSYYLRTIPLINAILNFLNNIDYVGELPLEIDRFMKHEILQGMRKSFSDFGAVRLFKIRDIDRYRDKSVVLYGAGDVGSDYYTQIVLNKSIKLVAWVDSRRDAIGNEIRLDTPQKLRDMNFEVLIIAVYEEAVADEISNSLLQLGIPKEKLVWERPERMK